MATNRIQKFFSISLVTAIGLALTACKVDAPITVNAPIPTPIVSSLDLQKLTCAAYIAADSSGAVEPDKTIPVTLQVGGGSAPYSVNGVVGTFLTQVNVNRTYSNDTSNNLVVNDSIEIKDNSGSSVTCALTVTVLPKTSTPSDLACSLTASKSILNLGEQVEYTATVSGGTAPYAFVSFAPGNGGTTTSSISATSNSVAKAKASYSLSGSSTATVIASDINGDQISCSKTVSVLPSAFITVAASPSTAVWSDQVITLNPTAVNFAGTVSYTYTTTEPKAVITRNGNLAFVSVNDTLSHSFIVVVAATDGVKTVTLNVSLSFVARNVTTPTLTCIAKTYYNPSYLDEEVLAVATPSGGVGTVRLTNISSTQNSYMSYWGASGLLSAYVSFGNVGTFPVTLTVQDSAGNTASCSTNHSVQYYYGNYWY